MQRKGRVLLFLVLTLLVTAGGCKNKIPATRNEISVSILPFKYIAEQLTNNHVKVNCMLAPGDNPATYQPIPQQIASLEKSMLYFMNGHLVFETAWIPNIKGNNPSLKIIDCSKGISLIQGHSHSHSHDEHAGEHSHNADPHYWTLPENAKQIAKNMHAALIASEIMSTDSLNLFYKNFLEEIDDLSQDMDNRLLKPKKDAFLIYHPALSYIAKKYNLLQIPLEQDGKAPSVSQLKHLVDHANQHELRTIFIQKQFDKDNASLLSHEIDATIVTIDPLAYNYIESMKDIGIKLQKALNE